MKDWTMDICILKEIRTEGKYALSCSTFIYNLESKEQHLCIDYNGDMIDVYQSLVNLNNPSDIIGRWWKKIQRCNLLSFIFLRVPKKLEFKLSKLNFDSDDMIFVGVAAESISKKIVSIDSDFGCNPSSPKNRKDIKELLENFNIYTIRPEDAVNEM